MRTLQFIVDNQIIKQDPKCDFDNLVPGTEKYLRAEFSFSKEWSGLIKTAKFYNVFGSEYPDQKIKDGKTCMIPADALNRREFKVQVVGENTKYKIKTNKMTISQKGGV